MWTDKCWQIRSFIAYIECIYNIKPTYNVTTATLTDKKHIKAWGCLNIMSTSNVTTATITLSYIFLFTLRRYIDTNRQLLNITWMKKLCIWKVNGRPKKKHQRKFNEDDKTKKTFELLQKSYRGRLKKLKNEKLDKCFLSPEIHCFF